MYRGEVWVACSDSCQGQQLELPGTLPPIALFDREDDLGMELPSGGGVVPLEGEATGDDLPEMCTQYSFNW